jgi:anthranilate 1,2-dioxygenase small subunit
LKALRVASNYNIHSDRHVTGPPRIVAAFAVYQTEQENDTRLLATGLYRDRLEREGKALKISEKTVLVDSFAVLSLLATPLLARSGTNRNVQSGAFGNHGNWD